MTAKKIIIDTDCGIDDAIALKVALHYFKNRFNALSVVGGNIPLEKAVQNAGLLIPFYKEEKDVKDMSLYKGNSKPLKGITFTFAYEYHSADGLGGLSRKLEKKAKGNILKPLRIRACDAIARIADKENHNTLSLITIGPLTNIAKAILKYPDIMGKLREIFIMGGSFNYPGNITPLAEFNIYCDPFAASIVFSSGIPLKVIGLNITEKVYFKRDDVRQIFKGVKSGIAVFLKQLLIAHIKLHQSAEKFNGAFLHDPVAIIAAVKPGLFKWKRRKVDVVTGNLPEKGMTYADLREKSPDSGNTLIAVDLNINAVKKYIAEGIR